MGTSVTDVRPPQVVVVGSAARDLTPDDPRGWRLGGGVTYSALAAARLGVATAAVIGVDEPAAAASELDLLREASVEIVLARLARSPVFDNVETPEGRVQHGAEPGDPIPASSLPPAWRDAPAWILAPVADELPGAWAAIPPPGAQVALGWQGILRDVPRGGLVRRRVPSRSALLERATIVGVSRHDVDPATTIDDLRDFLHPGATLVMTHGDEGGRVSAGADGPHDRSYEALPAGLVADPTGAGDVFLATLLTARSFPALFPGQPALDRDLRLASAAASLVVEGPGLDAVPWRRDVIARALAQGGSSD